MVLIIISLFIINFVNKSTEKKTLKNYLDDWKVLLADSKNFLVSNYRESSIDGIKISDLTATKLNQTIILKKISNADENFQKNYFADKTTELNFLFEPSPAPYPGVITRTIICPNEFKPVVQEKDDDTIKSIIYIMYSNERLAYGICSKDLTKYRAVFSLVYCKTKQEIYQIEYFKPVEEFTENDIERMTNFQCS